MAKTYVKIDSKNTKLKSANPVSGKVISATSRTSDTCAPDCPFIDKGEHNDIEGKPICYANENLGRPSIFQHAEKYGVQNTSDAMDKLQYGAPKGSAVRHLVSGDVASEGDDYVRQANKLHAARKDLQGWGYTHNWRSMNPGEVKGWTLNASTETSRQAEEAVNRGWQAVIESPKGQELAGSRIAGRRVVSCPNQSTHGLVGCADCTLCRSNSPTRPIVEFQIHGKQQKKVSEAVVKARQGETRAYVADPSGNMAKLVAERRAVRADHFKVGFADRGM
jgi:hypothetical protein